MKKAFLVVAVAAFSFALPSCKKCSTCEYTYTNPITNAAEKYSYPEQCGKKKDIDNYEAACKSGAQLVGGTCNCKKS